MNTILIVILAIPIIIAIDALYVNWRARRLPFNTPQQFLKLNGIRDKKVLVCVGDSITHGHIGTSYVNILREEIGNEYNVVNAGINGHLAWNLLQRIEDIITCKPDIITILIGTNDANATFTEAKMKHYVKDYDLPRKADKEWFVESMNKLIDELKKRTTAEIYLLSLPTIGEKYDSTEFKLGQEYSKTILEVAERYSLNYIPLSETMSEKLIGKNEAPDFDIAQDEMKMTTAIIRHYWLFQDWDKISKQRNLDYHVDYLHMNGTGARIIADLIIDEIRNH